MFEVVEMGPLAKGRWWSLKQDRNVKLRVTKTCFIERQRHFHRYRADFEEGSVITVSFPQSELIAVGDKIGLDVLASSGRLDKYFRPIVTS